MIKKISKQLIDIQKAAISAELTLPSAEAVGPRVNDGVVGGGGGAVNEDDAEATKEMGPKKGEVWKSVSAVLEDELNEAGDETVRALKEKQREMIDALDLRKSV